MFLKAGGEELVASLKADKTILYLANKSEVNDYFTSFLADYLRNKLLCNSNKLTFETVMSHPSKLKFMRKAKEQGGHDVPNPLFLTTVTRSLNYLPFLIMMN